MKIFQKNNKVDTDRKLLAIVEQETKELRERREKISHDLDLCIQAIRCLQRNYGVPEEEYV